MKKTQKNLFMALAAAQFCATPPAVLAQNQPAPAATPSSASSPPPQPTAASTPTPAVQPPVVTPKPKEPKNMKPQQSQKTEQQEKKQAQQVQQQTQSGLPLFFQKIELLDTQKHKALAVAKEFSDLGFASQANIIPVVVSEISLASKHYPLVFVVEPNATTPTLVAMVGLGDNKNLYVDSKGKWRAGVYIPAWVRRYPFLTVKAEENREAIAFDPTAKVFFDKNNLPLFENDQPTETLKQIVAFQNEINAAFEQTGAIAKALQDAGVLEAATLAIGSAEKDKTPRNITGFLVVNEAKLRALDSETVNQLHKANALGLAYAQLISMANLQNFQEAK